MRIVHVESFLNEEKLSKEYSLELLCHFWIHATAAEESKQYPENLISQMEEEKCTMSD